MELLLIARNKAIFAFIGLFCAEGGDLKVIKQIFRGISIEKTPFFSTIRLPQRTLIIAMPVLTAILAISFLVTGLGAKRLVDGEVARNAQLQTKFISASLEHLLYESRKELLLLSTENISEADLHKALLNYAQGDQIHFREIAFVGLEPQDQYLLVNHQGQINKIPQSKEILQENFAPGPGKKHGSVSISRPREVSYPLLSDGSTGAFFHVIRLSTPVHDRWGNFRGALCISLDLADMRDKLSLPVNFTETATPKQAIFFFDQDGWMLFQSNESSKQAPLAFETARQGLRGDFGRPGSSMAFRPAPEYLNYWNMVADVRDNKAGLIFTPVTSTDMDGDGIISYAPVTFQANANESPLVLGGVALIDNNFTTANPGVRLVTIYIISFTSALLGICLLIWLLAKSYDKRLNLLTDQITDHNLNNDISPLRLPPMPLEFEKLQAGVNGLLARLQTFQEDRDNSLALRNRRLSKQIVSLPKNPAVHANYLAGEAQVMQELYANIERAARSDADILIIGETGTGKELVASAIHHASARSDGPFLSINCGALDEALLMDTLFGHARGAYTEAKTERKGIFLAANGGTLLLDEIGNAPPRVQQALLRALSTRKIRPLGTDLEIPFNTRIIAATNKILSDDFNSFRKDLYYRLAVIRLETPPLRSHLEDLPVLIAYFLNLEAKLRNTAPPQISRGALKKLEEKTWPGNVRELKNLLTRAAAFCNGKIIQEEDLESTRNSLAERKNARQDNILQTGGLNARQLQAWKNISSMENFTRNEYQQLAGNISARSAQYDLRILQDCGLIRREGSGASQRYVVIAVQ